MRRSKTVVQPPERYISCTNVIDFPDMKYDGVVLVGDSRLRELPVGSEASVISRGGLMLEDTPAFVKEELQGERLKNKLVVLCVGINNVLERNPHPECVKRSCKQPFRLSVPKLDPGWEEKLLAKLRDAKTNLESIVCGEGSRVLVTCPGSVHVPSMMDYAKNKDHCHYLPKVLDKMGEREVNTKLMAGLNYIHNELKHDVTYQQLGLSDKLTCSLFQ